MGVRNETIVFVATYVNIHVVVVLFAGADEKSTVTFITIYNLGCMICLPDESGYSIAAGVTPRIGAPQLDAYVCPLQGEMWWWYNRCYRPYNNRVGHFVICVDARLRKE